MMFIVRVLGLFLLLLPLIAWGQTGSLGLFDAQVTVQSESAQERRGAAREGLTQVLQRLTGRQTVLEDPNARAVLDQAENYIEQFGYEQEEGENGEPVRKINLRFDGVALERALVERGVGVWSQEGRPRMLFWVALDKSGSREVIGGDVGVEEQQILREVMASRGLPFLFPLMDLEDQQALRPSDLWGGFRGPIQAASERYQPGAVVAGRLAERDGRWQGRWLLFWDGSSHEVTASDQQLSVVMAAGADGIAAYLGGRLSAVPDRAAGGVIRIRVEGMRSLQDYAWLQELLQEVQGVERSDPYRVTERYTDFRVQANSDTGRVLRVLENSQRLSRAEVGRNDGDRRDASGRGPDYFFRMR